MRIRRARGMHIGGSAMEEEGEGSRAVVAPVGGEAAGERARRATRRGRGDGRPVERAGGRGGAERRWAGLRKDAGGRQGRMEEREGGGRRRLVEEGAPRQGRAAPRRLRRRLRKMARSWCAMVERSATEKRRMAPLRFVKATRRAVARPDRGAQFTRAFLLFSRPAVASCGLSGARVRSAWDWARAVVGALWLRAEVAVVMRLWRMLAAGAACRRRAARRSGCHVAEGRGRERGGCGRRAGGAAATWRRRRRGAAVKARGATGGGQNRGSGPHRTEQRGARRSATSGCCGAVRRDEATLRRE